MGNEEFLRNFDINDKLTLNGTDEVDSSTVFEVETKGLRGREDRFYLRVTESDSGAIKGSSYILEAADDGAEDAVELISANRVKGTATLSRYNE